MIYTTYTRPQPKDKREGWNFSSLSENQSEVRKLMKKYQIKIIYYCRRQGSRLPRWPSRGGYHNVSEQWLLLRGGVGGAGGAGPWHSHGAEGNTGKGEQNIHERNGGEGTVSRLHSMYNPYFFYINNINILLIHKQISDFHSIWWRLSIQLILIYLYMIHFLG